MIANRMIPVKKFIRRTSVRSFRNLAAAAVCREYTVSIVFVKVIILHADRTGELNFWLCMRPWKAEKIRYSENSATI